MRERNDGMMGLEVELPSWSKGLEPEGICDKFDATSLVTLRERMTRRHLSTTRLKGARGHLKLALVVAFPSRSEEPSARPDARGSEPWNPCVLPRDGSSLASVVRRLSSDRPPYIARRHVQGASISLRLSIRPPSCVPLWQQYLHFQQRHRRSSGCTTCTSTCTLDDAGIFSAAVPKPAPILS